MATVTGMDADKVRELTNAAATNAWLDGNNLWFSSVDGGEWLAGQVGKSPQVDVFATSGVWTKPAGAKAVYVRCISGGGGGDGSRFYYATISGNGYLHAFSGAGGGGGGCAESLFPADLLSASEYVVVGSGGSGGTGLTSSSEVAVSGGTGGATTFGQFPNIRLMASGGGASHLSLQTVSAPTATLNLAQTLAFVNGATSANGLSAARRGGGGSSPGGRNGFFLKSMYTGLAAVWYGQPISYIAPEEGSGGGGGASQALPNDVIYPSSVHLAGATGRNGGGGGGSGGLAAASTAAYPPKDGGFGGGGVSDPGESSPVYFGGGGGAGGLATISPNTAANGSPGGYPGGGGGGGGLYVNDLTASDPIVRNGGAGAAGVCVVITLF